MKITVSRSSILKELNLIQGVVEKKSTIPILSNLLLEAKDGALTIKGTDLDVSVTTWCEGEVEKEGSSCLQAKKLFDIVRALPNAEIELKSSENNQISITCERSKFKMMGLSKDMFPEIKEYKGTFVAIPADLLKTLINRTFFSISNEESRYSLNGAKFEFSKNNIRMVATDGHRLSYIDKAHNLETGTAKIDVLIPKKTLSELVKLCTETDESVEFSHDDNHLFFKVGKRLLISRTLSGQFPNYEMVLTKENTNRFVIESELASSAIRRVSLMADEKSHAIKVDIDNGQVNITSQAAEIGEAGEALPIDYAGPAITTGFNAQYLLDFFSVAQSEEVSFELKDGNSRAQLTEKGDSDYDFRYIIMPMRL